MENKIEIRTFEAEVRSEDDKKQIKGMASVFNKLSVDLGGFKEIIDPGSFGDLIYKNDVFALINHDENRVLGRNQKSKTLRLFEDNEGLKFEVDPPDTTYANDLLISMARGDMDKCSFAFRVASAYWEILDGWDVRHITKFAELYDVSVVTYPAFPQTYSELFGKEVKSPDQVYKEYRSITKQTQRTQELIAVNNNKLRLYEKIIMKGQK